MKQILTFLLICLGCIAAFAQQSPIVVVGSNGTAIGAYSNLEAAVTSATSGASVYIPGGFFTISGGSLTIDKQLNIIGVGHNLDSTLATGRTQIDGYLYFSQGASGGSVQGIYFTGGVIIGEMINNTCASNFTIFRCNLSIIQFLYVGHDYAILECIVRDGIYGSSSSNVLVKNTFMSFCASFNNAIFQNCVFLYSGYAAPQTNNTSFINCIFAGNSIFNGGYNSSNNNLYNCLMYNSINTVGAIANINPVYVNTYQDIFINSPNAYFDYTYDFQLKPNCPGKNAGTDGLDIGVYGGMGFKAGSVPNHPHIYYKNIATQTDINGNLNVNVKISGQSN